MTPQLTPTSETHDTFVIGLKNGRVAFLKSYDYRNQKEEAQSDFMFVSDDKNGYDGWYISHIGEYEATKFANENYEILDDFGRSNRPNIYDGYVAALISERLKAKALLEALEEIADLLLGEPSEVNVLDARLKARIAVEDYNHHQQL